MTTNECTTRLILHSSSGAIDKPDSILPEGLCRNSQQKYLDAENRWLAIDYVQPLDFDNFKRSLPNHIQCIQMQKDQINYPKKLAVFDMDSTLIQQEVIVEMADALNLMEKVNDITERAMNGELDFKESFKQRLQLLDGLSEEDFLKVKSRITLTPGAKELCAALKKMGCYTVVLSGGFQIFADYVKGLIGLDEAHANKVEILDGKVVGRAIDSIMDGELKKCYLEKIAESLDVRKEEIIAVGDGSNDLLMMHAAGFGLAYNAKPSVQRKAPLSWNGSSMLEILYLLGIGESAQHQ